MTIWIDAQMSPSIAAWVSSTFGVHTVAVRDVGLRDAKDQEIFQAARKVNAAVMTRIMILCYCFNDSDRHLKWSG